VQYFATQAVMNVIRIHVWNPNHYV